jgi:hypothetical protein
MVMHDTLAPGAGGWRLAAGGWRLAARARRALRSALWPPATSGQWAVGCDPVRAKGTRLSALGLLPLEFC